MYPMKILAGGVILIILFIPGRTYSQELQGKEAVVEIARVKKGQISQELSLTADIGPESQVSVVPRASGTLDEIKVELGDKVKKGEVIARIKSKEILLGVKQAEAALLSAQASYKKAESILRIQAEANLRQAEAAFAAAQTQLDLAKSTAEIDLFSNLEQAQALLKSAQAQLAKIKEGAREEEIQQVRAVYEQVLASSQNAEKDLSRARDNYEKGAISEQQFGKAELQSKIARAQLESAKANLDLIMKGAREEEIKMLEAQVEQVQARLRSLEGLKEAKSWEAKIKTAQAGWENASSSLELARKVWEDKHWQRDLDLARIQVEQAKVALELAGTRLADCTIKAPISGIISKRFAHAGSLVGPTQPLVSIVDVDTVKLLTHVSDEDIGLVKLTQRVGVKVDTYLDRVFEVKEINISPVMDPLSRKIEVEIKISNPDYLMKPGMFPRVRLLVQRDNTLLIPREAIMEKEGEKQVFVIRDARVYLQKISTGLEKDGLVEVLSPLKEGEAVVVAGASNLKDGDKVRAQEGGQG